MVELARLDQSLDVVIERATKIRMGILADDRLRQELLHDFLRQHYCHATVAGCALTLEEYLQLLQTWVFDVGITVLSDEYASSESVNLLWQQSPRTRNLVVIGQLPDARLHNLMEANIPWLVNMHSGVEEIMKALKEIEQNQAYMDPTIRERLNSLWNKPKEDVPTGRELDMLQCMAQGFTTPQIAQLFCLSKHTVKSHTTNLFRKIGVASRQEAAVYAWREGLVRNKIFTQPQSETLSQKPHQKKR